ncbi:MAG TPA: class I SAM-dependent methyltransferase [Blastocatellia bacterium]|nr:class I SAM-dependent methyltransferase [Blastocatellia bacterium]
MSALKTAEAVSPLTEIVKTCPLCKSEGAEKMFPVRDRLHGLPGEFALVRCGNCSLVRLSPRPVPESLSYYYPEAEYYSYQTPTASIQTLSPRAQLRGLRNTIRNLVLHSLEYPVPPPTGWQRALQPLLVSLFRTRALYGMPRRFPRYRPGGRALDIGCGNGAYLSYLKHHGWQVAGVDISAEAAATAKREFDIDVFAGQLQDAPFEPASFDFIHMSHVIEHVPDPLEVLYLTARLLKPGGHLYIETPNVDSAGCRQCGRYWFPWESPRHLFLFSPDTLRQILCKAEFAILDMQTIFFQQLYHWEATYQLEERRQSRLSPRPQLRLVSRPRAILLWSAARFECLLHPLNGDILCCWATKK